MAKSKKKQEQIMYMLSRDFSIRKIAKYVHVAKKTVQDYKKYGPPFYREHLKNTHANRSTLENDQIRLLIEEIEELKQHNKKLTGGKNNLALENEKLQDKLTNKNDEIIKITHERNNEQIQLKDDFKKTENLLALEQKEKEEWKQKYYESKPENSKIRNQNHERTLKVIEPSDRVHSSIFEDIKDTEIDITDNQDIFDLMESSDLLFYASIGFLSCSQIWDIINNYPRKQLLSFHPIYQNATLIPTKLKKVFLKPAKEI